MPINAEQAVLISYIKDAFDREEARTVLVDNKIHMLDDDYLDLIRTELRKYLSEESWGKMDCYSQTTINVFADIITQLSEIYLDDPVREFSVNEKTKGKKIEEIENVYDKAKINQVMDRANSYMNAVNDVILHPVIRNGNLEVDILTPNVIWIIEREDDPTKPWAVLIEKVPNNILEMDKEWVVWTDTQHYLLDKNGNVNAIEGNEEMINPYGILPFVFLHKKKSDGGFWNETDGEDLYICTVLANVKQALINFYFVWNSFKQISVSTDDKLPGGLIIAPDKILKTPEHSEVSVLDYQVRFEALDKTLDKFISRVSKRYGVDKSDFGDMKESSGRALKIKNQKLQSFRKRQIKIFRDCENDLLFVIVTILYIEGLGDYRKMGLDVYFSEPETFIEPKEQIEIEEKEIILNLKSLADIYMARNKSCKTRDEALEKLREIIKDNNELRELSDESINNILNKKEGTGKKEKK